MAAVTRTLTLLSVILLWKCSFSPVDSRPFAPKKHTMSPSKHRHNPSTGHKNAIMHPQRPASLRELALGSHKAAREILPFHFSSSDKLATKGHHKHTWGAVKPHPQTELGGFGGALAPVAEAPAAAPSNPNANGFGVWVAHESTDPVKGPSSSGFFGGAIKTPESSNTDEDDGVGAWGAFQPLRHTQEEEDDGFGGNSRPVGGTSKAIHMIPGQPPQVVEESLAAGAFGAFLSSDSSEDDTDTADGWFMSFVPYPEPTQDQDQGQDQFETQSSSSDAFADMWGLFRDRKNGCGDGIAGRSCSSNADCRGCNRKFECSANRCQTV